MFAPV